jgi:hypothetical protein
MHAFGLEEGEERLKPIRHAFRADRLKPKPCRGHLEPTARAGPADPYRPRLPETRKRSLEHAGVRHDLPTQGGPEDARVLADNLQDAPVQGILPRRQEWLDARGELPGEEQKDAIPQSSCPEEAVAAESLDVESEGRQR